MEAPPLAVLCIRIADTTTSLDGSNAMVTFHHLKSYYRGRSEGLTIKDLPYSLSSQAEIAQYHALVSETLAEINLCVSFFSLMSITSNVLLSCSAIAVFLVTHSTPDTGDLHFIPNCGGAASATEVMDFIFPNSNSILALMTCGAAITQTVSRQHMKDFAKK
jgi:hypothetical protein